uniref:Nicastrin n=1 Tax=Cyprinus carpio TaxID=7962 RepID=A0A8C1LVY6_CYPCA
CLYSVSIQCVYIVSAASVSPAAQYLHVELSVRIAVMCLICLSASMSGDTGVLHVLETQSDLDWILSSGPHPPYMVIMETAFFNRCCVCVCCVCVCLCVCLVLCLSSSYYNEYYCNPLYSVTFVSLPPSEVLCDPLSDFNVWTSTRPLNSSAKGHAANESVVIAAARLDGRSFFWEQAPAAEGTVSGIITLLAAIQALYPVTQEAPPPRNIFFTFFQGEAFDYIGSSKMVYDMEKNDFVIDLKNVHSILEIGQVGLHSGRSLWMHSDPVSRKNDSVNEAVSEMMNRMESAAAGLSVSVGHPSFSQPLPPSSLQRFLRAGPIPGLVLADHQKSFSNRYYESMYDDAENLNVTYPPGLTPDEQLVYETDAAKSLAEVATLVARSLYLQAGGENNSLSNITADPKTLFSYFWVSGPASVNSTGEPFCVRASVRLSEAVSPAFELLEYGSRNYSTWTESRWKSIRARIFLVASRELEMLTLGVGVAVLLLSLLVTYFISSKAELLFSSARDTPTTAY